MNDLSQNETTKVLAVTMSPEAAEKFMWALSYAMAVVQTERIDDRDPSRIRAKAEEVVDWLMWGHSRVHGTQRGLI